MSASLVERLFELLHVFIVLDGGSSSGLLDERLHYEDIESVPLFDECGGGVLASEGVTDQTQFQREPVGSLGVLQATTRVIIQLDNLLKAVTEQEVVGGLVLEFKIFFLQNDVISGSGCLCVLATLSCGSVFDWCAHKLLNQLFVGSHELYWPLTLVSQVINKLEIVKLLVCWVTSSFSRLQTFTSGLLCHRGGKVVVCVCDGLVFLEKLEPLSPVALVVGVGVEILFVIIGLISDVEDGIHEAGAERSAPLGALLVLIHAHLTVAALHFPNTSVGLLLEAPEKRFFFDDAILNVKVTSALVLLLTQFSVLNDQIFALVSPPDLIIQLLLLVALPLGEVEHSGLALLLVQTLHDRVLLGDQAASALLTRLAGALVHCRLRLVLQPGTRKGESAIFSGLAGVHSGKAHCHFRCLCLHRALFAGEVLERFRDSSLSIILLHLCVDSLGHEGRFKLINAIVDFTAGCIKFIQSDSIEFFGLLIVKFKLVGFTLALHSHVLFPILNAFLVPFLHETGISLQFVKLYAAELLLLLRLLLLFNVACTFSNRFLLAALMLKLQQVFLHVESLLRLVQRLQPLLEKGVLHSVEFLLGCGDLLDGLAVSKLSGGLEHLHVSGRVYFLKHHLQLIEETEGYTTLLLHNPIDLLTVEFDFKVAEGRLQLLEVAHLVGDHLPIKHMLSYRRDDLLS